MAYIPPTINVTGITIPSYADIRDYLIEQAKVIYGEDIYLEEDSQDYQWLSTFALLTYDVCQCLILDYNSHSPNTAVGDALDRIAAYCGIARSSGSASTVTLTCRGTAGTLVTYASVEDSNGYLWQLDKEFTIGEDGVAYVYATCVIEGAIQAPIGSITKIKTPTAGWESCTNEFAATIGANVETDSHLRARLIYAISKPSVTVFDGLIASIQAIDNVLKVKGYENPTSDFMHTVIPPHSIAIVVEGGDELEIADAIYRKKTVGTNTYGDTSVTLDLAGNRTIDIKFNRPTYINASITINITTLNTWVDSIENEIKNNILDTVAGLEIGQTLYGSNLYYPILNAITDSANPSFFVTSVNINDGSKLEADYFDLIVTDASLITINKTEGE